MRVAVTPELVLDDETFEMALAELKVCAPHAVANFTWERFTARTSWALIPDVENTDNPWYKAEMQIAILDDYTQTLKLNVWRAPDLRRTGEPTPHNHPWPFVGRVLRGGYVETRYMPSQPNRLLVNPSESWDLGTVVVEKDVEHAAGTKNVIDLATFHEVTEILDPGRTVSLMDCDLGRKNGWGYIDPDTGIYTPTTLDPKFLELFMDRNPHLKK